MEAEDVNLEISRMARLCEVSRSVYWAWLKNKEHLTKTKLGKKILAAKIKAVHLTSLATYGVPRITRELKATGEQVSHNTVAALRSEQNICETIPRLCKVATGVCGPTAAYRGELVDRCLNRGN